MERLKVKDAPASYKLPVVRCTLVKDGSHKAPLDQISRSEDANRVLQSYLEGVDREYFVALLLNTKNKAIGIYTVSVGSLDSSIVHPREVFKVAIISNTAAIIVGHNHPSGESRPSKEDIEITSRLVDAGRILGIELLDHIITGGDGYTSLVKEGRVAATYHQKSVNQ
jgi:DNA repair protein RadC